MPPTACLDCGAPPRGTRCAVHSRTAEVERQPYRAAYQSAEYKAGRKERMRMAGSQCEYIFPGGRRCGRAAVETHHVVPLSSAAGLQAAVALCGVENLPAVCSAHNPPGQNPTH